MTALPGFGRYSFKWRGAGCAISPESALCKWFEERPAGARGGIRRVMIVALARKLLIALWRFSETGLISTGARLA